MSEINFPDPQAYDAETFGTALPQMKPERGGNRTLWIGCGGCFVVVALACVACGLVGALVSRWDVGQASFWAAGFQQQSYGLAETIVCEGSQAEAYTTELIEANAVLVDFSIPQGSSDDTRILGTMEIDGAERTWNAIITTSSGGNFGGGLFGRCIDEIRVEE
jgi:hypothetical protein